MRAFVRVLVLVLVLMRTAAGSTVKVVSAKKNRRGAGAQARKGERQRRLSIVALRSMLLRGLVLIGPSCIHQHNAHKAERR